MAPFFAPLFKPQFRSCVFSRSALCATLSLLACTQAFAEDATFSGEVGLGVSRTQSIIRGADSSTGPIPYLAFDYGRFFARIDTFGVKTLPIGYGHLELVGRYRADGYEVSGLERRSNPVQLGIGTLQVTPIGAFELNVFRDVGASAGTVAQARYIAKIPVSIFSLYPEVGVEMLDARYANYYYGTRQGEVASVGQSYTPGSAVSPFLGILVAAKITDNWALNTYWRRTLLDDTISRSPLVSRGGRNTMFVAAARKF